MPLLHNVWDFREKTQELGVVDSWGLESSEGSIPHMLGGCYWPLAETLPAGTVGWDIYTLPFLVVWTEPSGWVQG